MVYSYGVVYVKLLSSFRELLFPPFSLLDLLKRDLGLVAISKITPFEFRIKRLFIPHPGRKRGTWTGK